MINFQKVCLKYYLASRNYAELSIFVLPTCLVGLQKAAEQGDVVNYIKTQAVPWELITLCSFLNRHFLRRGFNTESV